MAKVLVEQFGLATIGTVEDDMKLFFGDKDEESQNDGEGAITADMQLGELLQMHPDAAVVLMEYGMHCFGCPASQMETLGQASEVHGFDIAELLEELNARVR